MKKITINRTTFRLYKKGSSTPIRLRSHTDSNLILVRRRDLVRVALVECGYWPSTREAYSLSSSSAFSLTVFTGPIPLLSLSRSP